MAWRAIFGLGNPGPRYALTRHNVGFMVLERLARRLAIPLDRRDAVASWGEGSRRDLRILLAEPLRFMNCSGEAAEELLPSRLAGPSELLVVHDELDLPLGRIKLKRGGGTAGHRGLESVRQALASPEFCRLRVGVGRPPQGVDASEYVLAPFEAAEAEAVAQALDRAALACEAWLDLGLEAAMGRVNVRPGDASEAVGAAPDGAAAARKVGRQGEEAS